MVSRMFVQPRGQARGNQACLGALGPGTALFGASWLNVTPLGSNPMLLSCTIKCSNSFYHYFFKHHRRRKIRVGRLNIRPVNDATAVLLLIQSQLPVPLSMYRTQAYAAFVTLQFFGCNYLYVNCAIAFCVDRSHRKFYGADDLKDASGQR